MSSYGAKQYALDVADERSIGSSSSGGDITSGVLVFVYDAGTKDLSTIYSDDKLTAKSNPITRSQFATDQKVDFFSTAESHDIFLGDDEGNCNFYPGITPSDRELPLNRSSVEKQLVIPFDADSNETDTGIDLPVYSLVKECFVEVTTADTTETLDVGLLSTESNGDANGILAAAAMGNTGIVKPIQTTAGTTETYVSTASYGALMGNVAAGTNAANDTGQAHVDGHFVSADDDARSIVYQASAGTDTGEGYIYLSFRIMR